MIQKHLIFLGGDDMGDEDGIKFREKYKTTEIISSNEPPKKGPDLNTIHIIWSFYGKI